MVGAGWNTNINLCYQQEFECDQGWNGVFAVVPEYCKSIRPYYISECLFGCQSCSSYCTCCPNAYNACLHEDITNIKITGSQVSARGPGDWLADNFGLPTDYQSSVSFEPRIDSFLFDLYFYLGFDAYLPGLYFKVHAPVLQTRWDLNFCECTQKDIVGCACVDHACTTPYWPGYFSSSISASSTYTFVGIECTNLVSTFEEYATGCGVIDDSNINLLPLCKARFSRCRMTQNGLADIQMSLGYNFLCNESYQSGAYLRAAVPTGNRPEGCYIFEPIVGNGKHWELGGGLQGRWTFWDDPECEQSLSVFIDGNVTHLFKTEQCRTFDLKYKPLSRYMLVSKFTDNVTDLKAGATAGVAETPSHQFAHIYSPLANITTFAVDVSINMQADLAIMFQWLSGNCGWDLGYEFWYRGCETIECNCNCPLPFEDNRWGLKGDACMFGYKPVDGTITVTSQAVPLSATQSQATLCKGTNNWPDGIGGIGWPQNPGIDNKQLAFDDSGNGLLIYDVANSTTAQIYTSKEPVLLKFSDLDLCSARTRGLSHKLFAHFDYTWTDCSRWLPFIGIGGEIEFGKHNDGCCTPPCNTTSCSPCNPCTSNKTSCCYCAVSQWGIWLKGGVTFK